MQHKLLLKYVEVLLLVFDLLKLVLFAVSAWLQFFNDAGIPTGLGTNYAVTFCDHRY